MKQKLIELITDISDQNITYWQKNYDVNGSLDSFTLAQLVFILEEEYKIVFDDEDIGKLKSLSALKNIVENKIS